MRVAMLITHGALAAIATTLAILAVASGEVTAFGINVGTVVFNLLLFTYWMAE